MKSDVNRCSYFDWYGINVQYQYLIRAALIRGTTVIGNLKSYLLFPFWLNSDLTESVEYSIFNYLVCKKNNLPSQRRSVIMEDVDTTEQK